MVIKERLLEWQLLVLGSGVGFIASFAQTIERIHYAQNPNVELVCNVSAIFSCSNVFDAWQSAVFGFSNSIMCLAFFAILLGIGLAGMTGSTLNKNLRLIMHFFTVFFLGFGAWYLQQSAYAIGYICLYCLACYSGVIAMNWSWLRLNAKDLPIGKGLQKQLQQAIHKNYDTYFWLLWAIGIALMMFARFYRPL